MATRRLSVEDISGHGVVNNTAPVVPVPTPNTTTNPVITTPNTQTDTGVTNPSGGSMNFNPIPNNTPLNPGDVVGFVSNFMFGDQHKTGDPMKDMAMDTFNKIKQAYGHNQAWSWMMQNGWNHLGNQIRTAMDASGIQPQDASRIINTYGSSAGKYFDGLRRVTQPGGFFKPDAQWDSITTPYRTYQQSYLQNKAAPLPSGYTPGQWGTTSQFQSTGTNVAAPPPEGYAGPAGVNPVGDPAAYNKFYGAAAPQVAIPKPEPKGPAVAQVAPGVAQTPAYVAPASTGLDVQSRSQPISTTNPTGAPGQAPYRFRPNR